MANTGRVEISKITFAIVIAHINNARLMAMLSANVRQRLETLQPEIAGQLDTISALAQDAVPAQLLELCTGYIDAALACKDWVGREVLS